jgi:hypothetical protein
MNDSPTVRMTASNTTQWNHSTFGLFSPDAKGAFRIPAEAVPEALRAGLVVTDEPAAVTAATGPLVVALYGAEAVTLDLSDLDVRLRLLELSDWTRIVSQGYATFTDSAGEAHTLTKAEATTVLAAARRRQHAA